MYARTKSFPLFSHIFRWNAGRCCLFHIIQLYHRTALIKKRRTQRKRQKDNEWSPGCLTDHCSGSALLLLHTSALSWCPQWTHSYNANYVSVLCMDDIVNYMIANSIIMIPGLNWHRQNEFLSQSNGSPVLGFASKMTHSLLKTAIILVWNFQCFSSS